MFQQNNIIILILLLTATFLQTPLRCSCVVILITWSNLKSTTRWLFLVSWSSFGILNLNSWMKIQPSDCQRIPLPPPCQELPANTLPHPVSSCQRIPLAPIQSAVASEYLYPHPVSSCYRIPLPSPCQQLLANTFTPTMSAVASEYPSPHPVSSC